MESKQVWKSKHKDHKYVVQVPHSGPCCLFNTFLFYAKCRSASLGAAGTERKTSQENRGVLVQTAKGTLQAFSSICGEFRKIVMEGNLPAGGALSRTYNSSSWWAILRVFTEGLQGVRSDERGNTGEAFDWTYKWFGRYI